MSERKVNKVSKEEIIQVYLIESSKNIWIIKINNKELSRRVWHTENDAKTWAIQYLSSWNFLYNLTIIKLSK